MGSPTQTCCRPGIGGHVMTDDDGLFFVNGIVPNERFSIYAELEDGSRSDVQSLTTTPGDPRRGCCRLHSCPAE